jgi:hypothetical protein
MTIQERISAGDRAIPLELIWKHCRTKQRSKLLRHLFLGSITAEGIRVSYPGENEIDRFEAINRAHWLEVSKSHITASLRKKQVFSLPTDDDGSGYIQILLHTNQGLFDLLQHDPHEIEISTEMADEALNIARNQLIGHAVYCEGYNALYSGLVPAIAAKLAYHLEDLQELWPKGRPQPGTLQKLSAIIVKTYKNRRKY